MIFSPIHYCMGARNARYPRPVGRNIGSRGVYRAWGDRGDEGFLRARIEPERIRLLMRLVWQGGTVALDESCNSPDRHA